MTDSPSGIGPIRRAHRKSRTGCTACKARKIKCDEHHPSCINCISHGLQCPFLSMKANLPPRTRPRPQSSQTPSPITQSQLQFQSPSPLSPAHHPHVEPPPPPPSSTSSSSSPHSILTNPIYYPNPAGINNPIIENNDDNDDDPLPTLHLLLLHNFTSSTYLTLTTDPTVANFWRTSVVDLAFSLSSSSPSSSYLLRVLLSVSALHLAFQQSCPQKRDFYTAQGILLHQKATREAMRRMLPVIEREEDELGLYLFANLTIYVALASPRGRRGDGRVYVLDQHEQRRHAESNGLSGSDRRGGLEGAGMGMGIGTGGGGLNFPDWAFLVNGPKSLSNFIMNNEAHREFLKPFLAYGGRRWKEARGESSADSSCNASPSNAGTPNPPESGAGTPTTEQKRITSIRSGIPKPPGPLAHLRELISKDTTNPHLHTYLFAIDELELSLTHLTCSSPTSPVTATSTATATSSPSTITTTTTPTLTTCAAEDLHNSNPNTQAGGDVLDAMLWLWAVSDSLVPLLKIHPTQEAVAIFAHFGILLKHHERQWWLQGWGDHLIMRAKDILDEEHRGWIRWPLEVLEGGESASIIHHER
ncbi:hypothetical protein GE21DRAFT_9537 [Neurospora crassa]|uniref:Zn(2)-C6 fungal-type domain-containing protein n=1 Tax=Neurospora crassa (strain ATCC 24698 / 74-OR23-1A / CBS 708.71 / DSM 1257 / FGSC 987) TaxID=367110 RepID=A7UW14_NEUCR|nr:hypothetical protein NCU10697 [Neurospora crassa OR74A]EDO65355.2 hypothetical protein NCU10697 [Neurospora crassa OR74A]KHE83857.1 hypothetical protein GE21DRAFT_9537 [Neurospora crassa]|eukprot:XP_001728446.2 hypothetical protein NCU10697 [Neurospora crassa OR74A]